MTTNRLSHSSSSAYQDCAKKWELRYKERLYPKTTSSALLFGSALDAASERYLQTGEKEGAVEEFINNWTNAQVANKIEFIPTSLKVRYANSDFDFELLEKEQINHILDVYKIESEDVLKDKLI